MQEVPDGVCGYTWSPDSSKESQEPEHCCYRDTVSDLNYCYWHSDLSRVETSLDSGYSDRLTDEIQSDNRSPDCIKLDGSDLTDVDEQQHLSLEGVSLQGADFSGIETADPDFHGSKLDGADFGEATLVNPDFTDANLNGAKLNDARIINGEFSGSVAKNTDFSNSQLIGCDFSDTNLTRADFTDADFNNIHFPHFDHLDLDPRSVSDHTDFSNANLEGATFTDVSLVEGIFREASLVNTDFSSSEDNAFTENELFGNKNVTLLSYCDFHRSDCQGANFSNSICSEANFSSACLDGGEFIDANISETTFIDAELRNINFKDSNLQKSNLRNSDVSGSFFDKADMREVNVRDMKCKDANFTRTTLYSVKHAERSQFGDAMLDGKTFTDSDIFELIESESLEQFFESQPNPDLAKVGLSDTDLSGLDLSAVDFYRADLSETNLVDATLNTVRLEGVDFSSANLADASLKQTNLKEAEIYEANLENVDLSESNLNDVDLKKSNISNADLSNTVLTDGDLSEANLENTDFSDANLQNATLQETNLEHAVFVRTNLFNVDLTECKPHGATFTDVQINDDTELRSDSLRKDSAKWWQIGPFFPPRRCGYDPAISDPNGETIKGQLGKAADTYQTFEKMARENARPSLQSEMFVLRQDMQRKRHWHNNEYDKWIFARISRAIFKHGESLSRIATSAIIIIGVFGLIYNSLNLITNSDGSFVNSSVDAVYFSTLTFTTLGLGDFKPDPASELARVLVTSQAALGAIIIAIFVFVLGRRAAK